MSSLSGVSNRLGMAPAKMKGEMMKGAEKY